MAVSVPKLKKQIMDKIDTSDLVQMEKLERYINLVELNHELDKSIKEDGAMVVTENGAQRFVKSHPAIGEKIKINNMLLAIEKSFVLKEPISEGDGKPTASDLI